jgi:hypothetical protein
MHREHKPLQGTTLADLLPDRVASFPFGRCKFIFSSPPILSRLPVYPAARYQESSGKGNGRQPKVKKLYINLTKKARNICNYLQLFSRSAISKLFADFRYP